MDNITTTTFGPPPTPIDPNPTRNSLKAVLLVTLFFGTFLAGTAAFPLRKLVRAHASHSPRAGRVFSLLSCFGAGVFLATCLLDLLPDAVQSVARAERRIGHQIQFPIPAFGISVGFLLVLLLEQAVLYATERGLIGSANMLSHHHHHPQQQHQPQAVHSSRTEDRQTDEAAQSFSEIGVAGAPDQTTSSTATAVVDEEEQQHLYGADLGEQHSTMRVYLLVFALSLHAVFEGLSVGMVTDVSALLQIFAALLIHKCIVGFSLGIRLVQSRLRPAHIVACCALFAGQTLVGGFIGLAVVDMLAGKSSMFLLSGILQAIACGTFLYITAFEILPHELASSSSSSLNDHDHGFVYNNRPLKILTLLVGFALITAFVALFPDAEQ